MTAISLFIGFVAGILGAFALKKFFSSERDMITVEKTAPSPSIELAEHQKIPLRTDAAENISEQASTGFKENTTKYRMLFETSTDAVFLEALDGRILDCNTAACDMFGYTKTEIIARNAEEFIPNESEVHLPEIINSRPVTNGMLMRSLAKKRNGAIFPTEVSTHFSTVEGEPVVIVHIRDISARKKAERLQAALLKISETAHIVQNIQELFTIIHKTMKELLPIKNFRIALCYPTNTTLRVSDVTDEEASAANMLGENVARYVLKTGRPLFTSPETLETTMRHQEIPSTIEKSHSEWMGVPLRTPTRNIGAIVIQSDSQQGEFGEEEKQTLISLATPIALALERVQEGESLRKSQETARALLNTPTDALALIDTAGTILDTNETLANIFHSRVDVLVGSCFWELLPDEIAAVRKQYVEKAIQLGNPVRFEDRHQGMWYDNVAYPMFDDQQRRVIKIAILTRDITARKWAEEALRESEQRFRKLSEATEEGIIVHNNQGLIIDANETFAEMFGYDVPEVFGISLEQLTTPDTWKTALKHIEAGYDRLFEVTGVKKDGTHFYCEVVGMPYEFRGKTLRVASVRDITQRKQVEESLLRMNESLEQVIIAFSSMFELQSLKRFATGALNQLHLLLQRDDKKISAPQLSSFVAALKNEEYRIVVGTGDFKNAIDQPLKDVVKADTFPVLMELIATKEMYLSDTVYAEYFSNPENGADMVLYMQSQHPLNPIDQELVKILSANISIAFDNFSLNQEIDETQKEFMFTIGKVVENRCRDTGNHVKRVGEYSYVLALKAGISETDAELLRRATTMHDVGKIKIPDAILNKPGKLTAEEFEMIKQHPVIGYDILKNSQRRIMKTAAVIALQHHERWDGKGYPYGLMGHDIHIFARIAKLADVFDALSHKRAYKDAWNNEQVIASFTEERGKQFDPALVDLFIEHQEEFFTIQEQYPDSDIVKTDLTSLFDYREHPQIEEPVIAAVTT